MLLSEFNFKLMLYAISQAYSSSHYDMFRSQNGCD
jgi:hypothetical protein